MLYGIRERKGFVQLTGEVGAGKTTLCRAMLEQLPYGLALEGLAACDYWPQEFAKQKL